MEEQHQIEILFSGGVYAIAYQTGFAKYLIELLGIEFLKKCQIGGISSGAAVAGYLHAVVHSNFDINYIFENYVKDFFTCENTTGLFPAKIMKEKSQNFYNELKAHNQNHFKQNNYHLYVTKIQNFSFKPMIVEEWKDDEEFSLSCIASGFIPFMTGFGFYQEFRKEKCIDGGFSKAIPNKFENSQKLFINVLPEMFYMTIPNNQFGLTFPNDYWSWNPEFADEMYLKGYLSGEKLKETILRTFNL